MDAVSFSSEVHSPTPINKIASASGDVEKTISAGTFGVAFFVRDNLTNTQGVIKVARSAVGEASNTTAEWEGFILERIFKTVGLGEELLGL
jgi:hypothetical protein